MAPERVLDTRVGLGARKGPVGTGQSIVLDLAGKVPSTATAVVLNVTGTETTLSTFVTVWPSDAPRPLASNLNLVRGETRPNLVTIKVSAARQVSLYNNNGSVQLIADLAGYYGTAAGSRYMPTVPYRMFDTRDGTGVGPRNPDGSLSIDFTGLAPATATAVSFNLTATNVTAATFVTAWPHGQQRPFVSNLNVVPGDTRGNLVTVALGTDRKVDVHTNAGTADLFAEIAGFYSPGEGVAFYPMTPVRVADTRPHGPATPPNSVLLELNNHVPPNASAFILNVTATEASARTSIAVEPHAYYGLDLATVSVAPGQTVPNLTAVVSGMYNMVVLQPASGSVHLIADLAGYFAPAPSTCTTGCVYALGQPHHGMLGAGGGVSTGAYYSSTTPNLVSGLGEVKAIARRYALRSDGTVWAWGPNRYGGLGRGWHRGEGFGPVAAQVVGLTDVTAIAASDSTAYALKSDGTVWGWGSSGSGQLGRTQDSDLPVHIPGLNDIIAVAASSSTAYALRSDGTLWAWGSNLYFDLGVGDTDPWFTTTPVQVSNWTDVTAIAAAGARYALRADGTVWTWGSNNRGQLGNGSAEGWAKTPVRVPGLTGVTAVAATSDSGFALMPDKTLRAWGGNDYGQTGTGWAERVITTPTPISGFADVARVVGVGGNGYALKTDGTVWGWGINLWGQLGTGDEQYYRRPIKVAGLAGVSAIAATGQSTYALIK